MQDSSRGEEVLCLLHREDKEGNVRECYLGPLDEIIENYLKIGVWSILHRAQAAI
ncbi:putative integrase [Saccharolobus islandicus]|uniref:putative integrase n=1 Tax=Saccharolobus islandicus TaxID=43080 RepID=UPI001112A2E8